MMVQPELDSALVDALRAELGSAGTIEPGTAAEVNPTAPATPPAATPAARLVARGKSATRSLLRPVVHRVADLIARQLVTRAELRQHIDAERAATISRLDQLGSDVEVLYAEMTAGLGSIRQVRHVYSTLDLVRAEGALDEVHAATVNLELVKAELRTVVDRMEQLGQAIAPATGLEGVAVRFSELRERVNALDRRLRQGADSPPVPSPAPGTTTVEGATVAPPSAPIDRFDYVGFEARFRGESGSILAAQKDRYLALLAAHSPVLDIGCGRGELLEVLGAEGVAAVGVDLNAEMVAEARGRGLDAHRADAVEWLRRQPERSLGSIISVHVVEHLELGPLIELLELAASRLVPGGILVAETPNPASLIVLGNSYILDPTHVRPLHPSLLTFLCERAGFRHVRLEFYAPAEAYHLPRLDLTADSPPWATATDEAFARLNDVLFGPQEYAVVATTPDPST
jgi:2-polyprenyl-3-methyl-5-hydroxy-6-metoxy-1,4-benzoquinol methylase